jgi:prepilin-type N-terminal cleavage/methylation domain-containing protein
MNPAPGSFRRRAPAAGGPRTARSPGAGRRREAAFTLIEVLLAVVLSAVMAAAVFGTLAAGRDASRRGEVTGEIDQIARQAVERIAEDLRYAVRPSETYDTGFIGLNDGDDLNSRDTLDFITAGTPLIPRRLGPVDGPDEDRPRRIDLARVLYAIDEDPTTPEQGLVRSEQTLLTATTVQQDRDLDRVELAPEAVSLGFRYLLGASWFDTWDSRQSNTLPQAVEITVTFRIERYGETHERTVRTVVRCAAAPPATQLDSGS